MHQKSVSEELRKVINFLKALKNVDGQKLLLSHLKVLYNLTLCQFYVSAHEQPPEVKD
jgi:hypothetical protein